MAPVVARSPGCDADDAKNRLAHDHIEVVPTFVGESGGRHDGPHHGAVIVTADIREDKPWACGLRRGYYGDEGHEREHHETESFDQHGFLQPGKGRRCPFPVSQDSTRVRPELRFTVR